MDIQVVAQEEMNVIGIYWNGDYSKMNSIPYLFDEMDARLRELDDQINDSIMIAPFHNRETELTYYVTVPVEKIEDVPDGMVGFTIPSKYYVRSLHKGSLEEVNRTFKTMMSWMADYGYELDHNALRLGIFKDEHKHLNASGNLHFELLLPVRTY